MPIAGAGSLTKHRRGLRPSRLRELIRRHETEALAGDTVTLLRAEAGHDAYDQGLTA